MSEEHKQLWDLMIRLESSLDNAGITDRTWQLIDEMKEILLTIE
jgi:hypothetical protein